MRCQVKTKYFLALLIITSNFLCQSTFSEVLSWESLANIKENVSENQKTNNNLNENKSRLMNIEPYSSAQGEVISSYIPYFKEVGHFFWGWNPNKEPSQDLKNESTQEPKNQTIESPALIFRDPAPSGMNELMTNLFVDFEVSDANHFRKVWFTPTPELKFRGLFGIHDFNKKRPLIIVRMGIHGNVDELVAERFLAKLIYEDLDANFLLLESLTSHAFLSSNKKISFGGVDEGLQTFIVLNEIEKSELTQIISSRHLLSISMGSQGTFVTALLDQKNGQKINSILNFCPLINLQSTFESGLQTSFKNAIIDLWNSRRLKAVQNVYPEEEGFHEWWKTLFDFKPRFTSTLLNRLNQDRKHPLVLPSELEKLIPGMNWPEGLKEHLENSTSFFDLNSFWPFYQGVKIPIMVYTTPKDPIVFNNLNSELIFRNQQKGDFTSLKYHRLERGVHCGLPAVYQWSYIVKLVKDGLELQ